MFDFYLGVNFWATVIRVATPVLFAAMAAMYAAKSGAFNMTIEGNMNLTALMGVIVSALTNNLLLGMLAGIVTGLIATSAFAYFNLTMKSQPAIAGVSMNLALTGGTIVLLEAVTGDKGASSSLLSLSYPVINIPIIEDIPFIGGLISGQNVLTYVSIIILILSWIFFSKTAFGLKIRAVGENADAAESVGINPIKVKFIALLCSGFLASLGGMFLSMAYLSQYNANMVAGRGFVGLAISGMAATDPIKLIIFTLIYAIADASAIFLQSATEHVQLVQMSPYVFIILIFCVVSYVQKKQQKGEDLSL